MNDNHHIDIKELERVQATNFVDILNFTGIRRVEKLP